MRVPRGGLGIPTPVFQSGQVAEKELPPQFEALLDTCGICEASETWLSEHRVRVSDGPAEPVHPPGPARHRFIGQRRPEGAAQLAGQAAQPRSRSHDSATPSGRSTSVLRLGQETGHVAGSSGQLRSPKISRMLPPTLKRGAQMLDGAVAAAGDAGTGRRP